MTKTISDPLIQALPKFLLKVVCCFQRLNSPPVLLWMWPSHTNKGWSARNDTFVTPGKRGWENNRSQCNSATCRSKSLEEMQCTKTISTSHLNRANLVPTSQMNHPQTRDAFLAQHQKDCQTCYMFNPSLICTWGSRSICDRIISWFLENSGYQVFGEFVSRREDSHWKHVEQFDFIKISKNHGAWRSSVTDFVCLDLECRGINCLWFVLMHHPRLGNF